MSAFSGGATVHRLSAQPDTGVQRQDVLQGKCDEILTPSAFACVCRFSFWHVNTCRPVATWEIVAVADGWLLHQRLPVLHYFRARYNMPSKPLCIKKKSQIKRTALSLLGFVRGRCKNSKQGTGCMRWHTSKQKKQWKGIQEGTASCFYSPQGHPRGHSQRFFKHGGTYGCIHLPCTPPTLSPPVHII